MAPSTQPSGADAVTSLLDPVVTAAGLVLEGVIITPAGKRRVVRVVVDLPEDRTGSLDLDAVAEVSRSVSDALDGSDVLGGSPYVLEVGTPGVDRPLTERRHWSRARGRLVTVRGRGRGRHRPGPRGRRRRRRCSRSTARRAGCPGRAWPPAGSRSSSAARTTTQPTTTRRRDDDEHDEHDEQDEED